MTTHVYVLDPPHDIDDQFGVQGLANEIAAGRLDPKDLLIVITGDFPEEARWAMYHVLYKTCGELAFQAKIARAQAYPTPQGKPKPGKLSDVVGADGMSYEALQDEIKEIRRKVIDVVNTTKEAQDNLFRFNICHADDTTANDNIRKILENLTEPNSVKLHLCAQSGTYLDGLKPEVIASIDVQGDASKGSLAGFNQVNSHNAPYIAHVLKHNDKASVTVWDTTATKGLGLRLSEFDDPSLSVAVNNYGAGKQLPWGLIQDDQAIKAYYNPKEQTQRLNESFAKGRYDLRLANQQFIMGMPDRFNLDRLLKERYVIVGANSQSQALVESLKAELRAGLIQLIADTKPFKDEYEEIDGEMIHFNVVLPLINGDGSLKKDSDLLMPLEKQTRQKAQKIIDRSSEAYIQGELALILSLNERYQSQGLSIDFGLVLYDPVAMLPQFEGVARHSGESMPIKIADSEQLFKVTVVKGEKVNPAELKGIFLEIGRETSVLKERLSASQKDEASLQQLVC